MLDRRAFLKSSGTAFLASLSAQSAFAFEQTDALFISACQRPDGSYAAAILSEQGKVLHWVDLPARGHDTTLSPDRQKAIVFARRPGTFALVIDLTGTQAPINFTAPPGRHFYGHGTFSPDGKILYTAENDFDNAIGIIGLYDATNGFTRLGELPSHDIGPHELALLPDGRTLVAANGGIETHPDYGRAKLNLSSMTPSISFLDAQTGTLIERHALPKSHAQLSLRHLTVAPDQTVWFAAQFQGPRTGTLQLIGAAKIGTPIKLLELPPQELRKFQNYISSIKFDADTGMLAAASTPGSHVALIDVTQTKIIRTKTIETASGIGFSHGKLISTGRKGALLTASNKINTEIKWDNHLTIL